VSVYRRLSGGPWQVEVEWRGWPRIRESSGSTVKARAIAMERTLYALKAAGRRDLLGLLADGRLSLCELHDDYMSNPAALEQRLARLESPALGALVDRWLAWLESPGALSRRRRPYSAQTVTRYRNSWQCLFAALPRGRDSQLRELTQGCVADYRAERKRAGAGAATCNRDLAALAAFLTWCEKDGIPVTRPEMTREKEPSGRERWLSADEITALKAEVPPEWWPFFGLLIYTGLRLGEAQGLLWGDVRLTERRITVQDRTRSLKTTASARDVPIPEPLAELLATHRVRYPGGPADPVFLAPFNDYGRTRRLFQRACLGAGLHDGGRNESGKPKPNATVHDLRHTFGVHSARAGVPIARLQKLMGHESPVMTLRYLRHAPESYFAEDAAKIAASVSGAQDREAHAALARATMKGA